MRSGRVANGPIEFIARIEVGQHMDDVFQTLPFLAKRLRPLLVVPDLRILELARDLRQPDRFDTEAKDTSADRRCADADLLVRH